MGKLLCIVGAAALAFVVVVAVGIGALVWTGRGLDAESKAYVDAAVPAIIAHWSKEALLDRATPELRAAVTPDQIAALFDKFSRLGALVEYEGATGDSNMSFVVGRGGRISAAYEAKAKYEDGEATLRVVVVKRDGKWWIQNFHVDGRPGGAVNQSM